MAKATPVSTQLACPECTGRGYVLDQQQRTLPCPRCVGVGVVGVVNGELVAYRETFSSAAINLERLHSVLRAVIDGVFVLFGLAGLVVGWFEFQSARVTLASLTDFALRQTPGMAVFWLSVLGDLYVYYRLTTESQHERKMPAPLQLEQPPTAFADLGQHPLYDLTPSLDRNVHQAVRLAWETAARLGHRAADDRHLFSALLGRDIVLQALARLGVPRQTLVERTAHLLSDADRGRSSGEPRRLAGQPTVLGGGLRAVLINAYAEARRRKAPAVEPLDVLVAFSASEGKVRTLLDDLGIEARTLRNVVRWGNIQEELRRRWGHFRSRAGYKPKGVMNRAMTAQATPVLDAFSHDLTALARAGATQVLIDRERETDAVFRALEAKSNAVLVGNPGVGKTAIVEGIANRMVEEDVPQAFQDKRLVSLSIPALVSGAGGMGALEERFSDVLTEVVKSGNIILFIDNLQNLIGVSSTGGQTLDLSGILAQALQSKRVFVLATTTVGDYSRYIEPSGALVSSFEKVEVTEMEPDDVIAVLESKVGHVEYEHKVFFSYEALEKMVALANRYLHDRFQPQKAIDLLEEVALAAHKRKGKGTFVSGDDVAQVVAEKTNVAVAAVTEDESEKLLHLEERIHERIVGQDEAVKAVSSALRRARAELRDPKRPIASFLFLGPTGVGKTELAKTVAATYFNAEKDMVRLDMSEYQDSSSLTRMLGAPPGYGGGPGYLTEAIRRNPYTVLLLDELEKAHPDILNVFLQVMDDGRLTDATGRTVDFTNAIIIATSNAGTQLIQDGLRRGAAVEEIKQVLMNEALKQFFRPEFLNRFDDIIVFTSLNEHEIRQIAGLMLKQVAAQLEERGITLRASPDAVAELAAAGFDTTFGARPLRRAIQDRVDDALADFLLKGQLGRRDVAVLEPGGVIRVEKAQAV